MTTRPSLDFDSTSCLTPIEPSKYTDADSQRKRADERIESVADKRLSDGDRLRMLGYDSTLHRPLGFWSSTAMTICHMSFVYDFIVLVGCFAYQGPLLFIIGYPLLAILNLILIGPFAELASAFPVSGAMATWSWRAARGGVRHERQWGYLASGLVLAAHIGKTIAVLYGVADSVSKLYRIMGRTDHQMWNEPVFHIAAVTLVALIVLTRAGRSAPFWITMAVYNIGIGLMFAGLIIAIGRSRTKPVDLDFPKSLTKTWTNSFSYMMFVGIPLRPIGIDCAAHMAEETKDASKNVPRSMYTAAIIHFVATYVLILMYIFLAVPVVGSISLLLIFTIFLRLPNNTVYAISILILIASFSQLVSATVVTTRFMFALGRDCGLPFSHFLSKTTKDGEPIVADLVVLALGYLTSVCYLGNQNIYYNIVIQTFGLWFVSITYIIPLGLYLFSKLDLRYSDRTQFTLHSWSKPSIIVSIVWLLLCVIQGCFPIAEWNNPAASHLHTGSINAFPFVVLVMLGIIAASWWLYGTYHYIGPIRALTKHTAGVEINPHDLATASGRANAISSYIRDEIGSGSGSSGSGNFRGIVSPLKMFTRTRGVSAANKSPTSSMPPRNKSSFGSPPHSPRSPHASGGVHSPTIHSVMSDGTGGFPMSLLRPHQEEDEREQEDALAESQVMALSRVHDETSTNLPPHAFQPFDVNEKRASRISDQLYLPSAQGESRLEPQEESDDEPALLESQLDPTERTSPKAYRALPDPTQVLSPPRAFRSLPVPKRTSRAFDKSNKAAQVLSRLERQVEEDDDDEPALLESQLDPTATQYSWK